MHILIVMVVLHWLLFYLSCLNVQVDLPHVLSPHEFGIMPVNSSMQYSIFENACVAVHA